MFAKKMKEIKEKILGHEEIEERKHGLSGKKLSNVKGGIEDRPLSKYFYEVKNHHDLYQVARSFWEDYEKGAKSFGLISEGSAQAKEKTILGVASYFDRNAFLRIGIISLSLKDSLYQDLIKMSHEVELDLGGTDTHHFKIKRVNNLDLIDYTELCHLADNQHVSVQYESLIQKLFSNYGLILWDSPEISFFKNNPALCFPMILQMNSFSVVVKQKGASIEKLKEINEFFDTYGVRIKGYILEA